MLTKRQKQIIKFIKDFKGKNGYAPSLEEIRRHLGVSSVSTVHFHLKKMQDEGFIEKHSNKPRSLNIYEEEKMLNIPLLGLLSSGKPIVPSDTKETLAVPQSRLPATGEFYALRISGNGFIDERITDGDIVLVKRQKTAENGEKVIALINRKDAVIKKLSKGEKGPSDAAVKSISGENTTIQGKIVGIIKSPPVKKIKHVKESLSAWTAGPEEKRQAGLQQYLNNVYCGDIMDVLKNLPDNSIDMVFGDPDYNVGVKYGDTTYVRDFDEYLEWYIELAKESMRVLKNEGNLFMMNYPKQNAHLRVRYLDNFYPLISEYVWVYNTNVGHTPKRFTTAHRSILHVRKSRENNFYKDNVAVPYKNPTDKRIMQNIENGSPGRMPYDWFYFDLVKNVSKEKTYHACQIPQKLTEMLIKSCTQVNDIVLVLFGGSGAELEVCKSLKRQYISAEIDAKYYELIQSRLKNGKIEAKYKLGKNKKEQYTAQLFQ